MSCSQWQILFWSCLFFTGSLTFYQDIHNSVPVSHGACEHNWPFKEYVSLLIGLYKNNGSVSYVDNIFLYIYRLHDSSNRKGCQNKMMLLNKGCVDGQFTIETETHSCIDWHFYHLDIDVTSDVFYDLRIKIRMCCSLYWYLPIAGFHKREIMVFPGYLPIP